MNIQNAVKAAHERWNLFPAGSTVVVGVSGGADSLALLHALATLRRRMGVHIVAATLDHGLRGEAGAGDALHVVRLAMEWQVPVETEKVDVRREAARTKRGIEETARDLRYRYLARVAAEHGTNRVAVAHHASDQAETVLLHLFRGAGLDGLAGMRPLTGLPEFQIVLLRPLLAVTRGEIEAYCRSQGIEYREDASNTDTEPTRNWLRHTVLPLVETRFPGAPRALSDLAESVALDEEWLAALSDSFMARASVAEHAIRLPRSVYREAPASLQRRFIRWAVNVLSPESELSHERTVAAVTLFVGGRNGQRVELPGELRAVVERETVVIARIGESD
ncbi:MAG: tRNA lysidine(34) synthetase TilS [Anaerolineae bacterium]